MHGGFANTEASSDLGFANSLVEPAANKVLLSVVEFAGTP